MKKYILSIIFIIFGISAYLQNDLKFERISTDIGLSEGFISCIIKDHRGFIWLASRDGLNRYDGYSFKIFKTDAHDSSSIVSNIIQVIYETKDSTLMIGTHGGLSIYDFDTGKFESFSHDPSDPSSLSNNAVYDIYEDRTGQIWIGTYGGGVSIFNRKTKKFKTYKNQKNNVNSLSGNAIRKVLEDDAGNIWVAVDGAGINKFDKTNETFTRFMHDPNDTTTLASNLVLCCAKDSKGYFWVGTWMGGITQFDPRTEKAVKYYKHDPNDPNTIASSENFQFLESSKGKYWICTRNGLNRLDPKTGKLELYQHDPLISTSLGYNVLSNLYEDKDGILWISTEGGGASMLDLYKKSFKHYQNNYKNSNSLSDNDVTNIFQDKDGVYWIATRYGLNKINFETNVVTRIFNDPNNPNSIPSNQIQCVTQDKNGYLWIGTGNKGVSIYNPETGKYKNYGMGDNMKNALINNSINCVYADSKGSVWLGSYGGGVSRFRSDDEGFLNYTIDPENLMKDVCLCLYEDNEGNIWGGTMGHGAVRYNEEKKGFDFFEPSSDKNSISSSIIYDIYEAYGYLWFCTGGKGFDRFDKKTGEFKNYNTKDGLANDKVLSMQADASGYLWISTSKGMSRFNIEKETFLNFDALDGLQSNNFNASASFKNSKGEMLFGGQKGFTMFHPDSIKRNSIIPGVAITEFKIFNESVKPDKNGILKKQITEAKIIEIPYNKNNFSFEFTSLHFSSPTKNKYKYKMEGYDEEWFETDHTRRFASYTNLPGGEYTFHVIASNNDGIWNEEGASIQIIIIPPYWKTIWFYMLVTIFISALIYMYIRYREKQAKKEKARLQDDVDKAVAEVEQQKIEIIEQNKELQKKQEEEKKRQWFNEGIAMFADILRRNKNDITELSNNILNNIIRYINATQGGLFIFNDDNEEDKYLQLIASYGYQKSKYEQVRIEIGESMVGNCYVEKKTKIVHNLPEGYLQIDSGLGHTEPKHLVLIPLKLDELIYGVLEIATMNEISELHIEFLEKLAESVASQLFTAKISIKTSKLLAQSQQQANELRAQEEEARQNIEEMEANKEEALRLRSEALGYLNSMNHSIIRADFDLNGKFTYGNTKFLDHFGYTTKEANKMHVTDFFFDEDRADFQRNWDELIKGSRHIEEKFRYKTKDGMIELLSTYTVVKDLNGQTQKILYLGLNSAEHDISGFSQSSSDSNIFNDVFLRAELDNKGHIISANSLFEQLYSLQNEDLEDLSIQVLMSKKEIKQFKTIWGKVMSGEKQELEITRKDNTGKEKWIKMIYIPEVLHTSDIQKISCIAYEISEYKVYEKQIHEKIGKCQEREKLLSKEIEKLKKKIEK